MLLGMQTLMHTNSCYWLEEKLPCFLPVSNICSDILPRLLIQNFLWQVMFVTGFEATSNRKNIHEIFIPGGDTANWTPNLFTTDLLSFSLAFVPVVQTLCVELLAMDQMQAIQKEEFDLVLISVFFMECMYPFIHKSQVSC